MKRFYLAKSRTDQLSSRCFFFFPQRNRKYVKVNKKKKSGVNKVVGTVAIICDRQLQNERKNCLFYPNVPDASSR